MRQEELEEQLWEQLKMAAEIAHDAELTRIHEGIQLLLEVMSSRAKEYTRLKRMIKENNNE